MNCFYDQDLHAPMIQKEGEKIQVGDFWIKTVALEERVKYTVSAMSPFVTPSPGGILKIMVIEQCTTNALFSQS